MWHRARIRDREPATPADCTTVRWLRTTFGDGAFTATTAQTAAQAWYAGRGWPAATPGIPEGLPAWGVRLRGLYWAGLTERGPQGYRLVKGER